jgi:hypothetical protein
MSENVGASISHKPKGLCYLYRDDFTFLYQTDNIKIPTINAIQRKGWAVNVNVYTWWRLKGRNMQLDNKLTYSVAQQKLWWQKQIQLETQQIWRYDKILTNFPSIMEPEFPV